MSLRSILFYALLLIFLVFFVGPVTLLLVITTIKYIIEGNLLITILTLLVVLVVIKVIGSYFSVNKQSVQHIQAIVIALLMFFGLLDYCSYLAAIPSAITIIIYVFVQTLNMENPSLLKTINKVILWENKTTAEYILPNSNIIVSECGTFFESYYFYRFSKIEKLKILKDILPKIAKIKNLTIYVLFLVDKYTKRYFIYLIFRKIGVKRKEILDQAINIDSYLKLTNNEEGIRPVKNFEASMVYEYIKRLRHTIMQDMDSTYLLKQTRNYDIVEDGVLFLIESTKLDKIEREKRRLQQKLTKYLKKNFGKKVSTAILVAALGHEGLKDIPEFARYNDMLEQIRDMEKHGIWNMNLWTFSRIVCREFIWEYFPESCYSNTCSFLINDHNAFNDKRLHEIYILIISKISNFLAERKKLIL